MAIAKHEILDAIGEHDRPGALAAHQGHGREVRRLRRGRASPWPAPAAGGGGRGRSRGDRPSSPSC